MLSMMDLIGAPGAGVLSLDRRIISDFSEICVFNRYRFICHKISTNQSSSEENRL